MKILCYGDSNTYGYDGDDPFGTRFPPESRWPELLGHFLGAEISNCGLNGRRVPRFQRNIEADLALLKRCPDASLILVMLGTNDILCEAEVEDTAGHMRSFLQRVRREMPDSALLLCAPPSVSILYGEAFAPSFEALADAYRIIAEELGLLFVDASDWQIPTGGDGVHFSGRGHRLFALRMGHSLGSLLK